MAGQAIETRWRYLTFAVGLPRGITCWHLGKIAPIPDVLYTCIVTARARANGDESYEFAEWEKGFAEKWARRLRRTNREASRKEGS